LQGGNVLAGDEVVGGPEHHPIIEEEEEERNERFFHDEIPGSKERKEQVHHLQVPQYFYVTLSRKRDRDFMTL